MYIETTIPSMLVDTRTSPAVVAARDATRRWWSTRRREFELCTSRFVMDELADARLPKAAAAIAALDGVARLDPVDGLGDLIDCYVEHRLMPRGAGGDAAHLAICSLRGVEYLLTWNCQHIANARKFKHLAVLNARLGLAVPTIVTPPMLLGESTP